MDLFEFFDIDEKKVKNLNEGSNYIKFDYDDGKFVLIDDMLMFISPNKTKFITINGDESRVCCLVNDEGYSTIVSVSDGYSSDGVITNSLYVEESFKGISNKYSYSENLFDTPFYDRVISSSASNGEIEVLAKSLIDSDEVEEKSLYINGEVYPKALYGYDDIIELGDNRELVNRCFDIIADEFNGLYEYISSNFSSFRHVCGSGRQLTK